MRERKKQAESYTADVTSSQDYYFFETQMPRRGINSSLNYGYGSNGKENDNEVKGEGNSVNFDARIYDSRVGKWLSTDPLQAKYPSLLPYNFAADNPIFFIGIDGRDIKPSNEFKASNYNKVYLYLSTNNSVYKNLIARSWSI